MGVLMTERAGTKLTHWNIDDRDVATLDRRYIDVATLRDSWQRVDNVTPAGDEHAALAYIRDGTVSVAPRRQI